MYFACYETGHASAYIRATIPESRLVIGSWVRLVWTHDGSTSYTGMNVYVDGVIDPSLSGNDSGPYVVMGSSGQDLVIGGQATGNGSVIAKIDQVQVYKGKEWTAGEAATDFALVDLGVDSIP